MQLKLILEMLIIKFKSYKKHDCTKIKPLSEYLNSNSFSLLLENHYLNIEIQINRSVLGSEMHFNGYTE